MSAQVNACVPVVYVTDVAASVAFYELLGLAPQAQGQDGEWRWAYLKCADVGVLLAAGGAVMGSEPGPILLYLRADDLEGIQNDLQNAGFGPEHLGYPDHAPGGEIKVLDPDGHTLLIGQITGVPPADRQPQPDERASILARAAAAARARSEVPHRCQFPGVKGTPCPNAAEVKMADSWGDSAWTCLVHAEEILINANGVFIAAEDSEGLGPYLRRRHAG